MRFARVELGCPTADNRSHPLPYGRPFRLLLAKSRTNPTMLQELSSNLHDHLRVRADPDYLAGSPGEFHHSALCSAALELGTPQQYERITFCAKITGT